MKKRILGNTGIQISEIGYGCAALWGKDVLGKQGVTEEQAYTLFETAFNHGINFFDTGINYGYAEERLGRCLKTIISNGIANREDFIIETKFGETINSDGTYGASDWSPDWVKKSVEISLNRLGLDYIDLFAMHGGSPEYCTDGFLNTLQDLKDQGIIRAFGVNTFDNSFIDWINKECCFDYVMLDYNIMKQSRETTIEALTSNGIGVLAGASLGQALFAKNIFKIKNRNDLWYLLRTLAHFRGSMKKSKDFRFLTEQKDFTGNQLALRYVLDNDNITAAVFNTTSVEHLVDNLKATEIVMPDEIRKKIKQRA